MSEIVRRYARLQVPRYTSYPTAANSAGIRADLDVTAPDMTFDEEFALLQPLVCDGLIRIEDLVVTATESGRSIVRVIAAVFDPHTRVDTARFSKAV